MGRQHQGMNRPGVRQVPEGSGEQEKMEKIGCEIICGAPTTLAVEGLMMMIEGRSAVIIRNLVVESNLFSDQYHELLCFVLRDFADLRHGCISRAFPPARKTGEKRHKK